MKKIWITSLVTFALSASAAPPPKESALQKEMRLLEDAMKTAVSAIANGDVRGLPKLFHGVHLASGDTKKDVVAGKIKLKKNADRVDAFIAMDDAFHKQMITLVKAAKKNDVDKVAREFGGLVARCNGCHALYREMPKVK